MDNGTYILIFNLWALLLALFLLRAYQSRSVRIQMVRTHNRSVVSIHRFRTWYRRSRGRLLTSLGRGLLWLVKRLEISVQPGRKAIPLHLRLLRSLFGSLFGLLPWYCLTRWLEGQPLKPPYFILYFLTVCAY